MISQIKNNLGGSGNSFFGKVGNFLNGGLFGGLVNLGLGIYQGVQNRKARKLAETTADRQYELGQQQLEHSQEVNAQNLQLQQEQFDWTKQQQNLMHQREDTAVQRRVNDLKAAGLSPVLAAGSAAQTHQPVQTHAPQRGLDDRGGLMESLQAKYNVANMYLNMVRQAADIAHTNAETRRIRDQIVTQQQSRDLAFKDYQLREMGVGLDKDRVALTARQVGISEQQLVNDGRRILQEQMRIENDSKRIFNDEQRIEIERNSLELQRLMNASQRGLISEQTTSEKLRQMNLGIETEQKIMEYKRLVYDLTFMQNLGLHSQTGISGLNYLNLARGSASQAATSTANRYAENYIKNTREYNEYLQLMGMLNDNVPW